MSDDLAKRLSRAGEIGDITTNDWMNLSIEAANRIEADAKLIQEMREAFQKARDMVWPMELNDRTMAVLRILDAALSKAKSQQEGETE